MGLTTLQPSDIEGEPFSLFLAQSLIRYLQEKGPFIGSYVELRSQLVKFTGRTRGWPKQPAGLANRLAECQAVLELQGVAIESQPSHAGRKRVSIALVREPEPGAMALSGPSAVSPPVTLEELERALCQGSDSPLMRESAALLYTLGKQARVNPKLVLAWHESATRAVALAKEAQGLVVASGQGDLAAFIEAEEEQPPSPSPTAEGEGSMSSDPTELE